MCISITLTISAYKLIDEFFLRNAFIFDNRLRKYENSKESLYEIEIKTYYYVTWDTVHCKLMHGSISTCIPISFHLTNIISSLAWQSHIWKASGIVVGRRCIFIPIDSMALTAVTDTVLVVLTRTTFESSEFFVGQSRRLKMTRIRSITRSIYQNFDLPLSKLLLIISFFSQNDQNGQRSNVIKYHIKVIFDGIG